ncbi:MAG: HalOD1 output domain-containing protein [Haloferacaceae archaeon]
MGTAGVQLIDQSTGEGIARYPISDGETASEAVLGAFELVSATRDDGQVLYDYVDPDALDRLFDGAGSPTLSATLWGHQVVVTDEAVTVYERG